MVVPRHPFPYAWTPRFKSIVRIASRLRRWRAGILAPFNKLGASFARRIRRAENKVARTGRRVSKSVASSAVGNSAKELARQGRTLETKASRFLIGKMASLLANLVPAPVKRLVRAMAQIVWRGLSTIAGFAMRWLQTRHYWQLVGGIPAFLLALPLAYCVVRMPFYGADAKAKHYRAAAIAAIDQQDYETAELYYRKLHQLDAMNELAEFQAAHNAYQSGNEQTGIAQFKKLAPADRPGFAPAHLWLAQWYLSKASGLEEAAALELAETHLQFALDRDPGNPQARSLRALHFERAGRFEEALVELREVVKYIPSEGLTMARIYARQGRWLEAQREIDSVLRIYAEKQGRANELTPVEFLIWSEAYWIRGEQDRAFGVLEQAVEAHPNDVQLSDRLFEQYMYRVSSLATQHDSQAEQLRLLKRCWQLKPDEPDPLIMISEMAVQPGEAGQAARMFVRDMMQSDTPPPALYSIMGTVAASEGQFDEAVGYLERACQAQPDDAQSLNNLAWVLLQQQRDLERAFKLSSQAVLLDPQVPIYRETRGQLLVRLGHYEEAIPELEFALNGLGDEASIHEALAIAYERLGKPELAEAHRRRIP